MILIGRRAPCDIPLNFPHVLVVCDVWEISMMNICVFTTLEIKKKKKKKEKRNRESPTHCW
jgi:hypothetical protein